MKTISKTLIAGAITAAMVLPASGAFAGEKANKAILGAVLGGLAGAALGDGDKSAVVIGAVAGAALGASTAQDKNDQRYNSSYRTRPAYSNYQQGYSQQGYSQQGYQVRDQRYARDNRYGQRGYDPRYSQSGHDPRYSQSGYDPRYSQSGYDPRYSQSGYDPRYDTGYANYRR